MITYHDLQAIDQLILKSVVASPVFWLPADELAQVKKGLRNPTLVYRGSEEYPTVTYHFFSAAAPNADGKRERETLYQFPQ